MGDKVIIYGKASWPHTNKARSAYGEKAIYADVLEDSSKLEEMLGFSNGVRKVPVIVDGEKVVIGYGGTWGIWDSSAMGHENRRISFRMNAILRVP